MVLIQLFSQWLLVNIRAYYVLIWKKENSELKSIELCRKIEPKLHTCWVVYKYIYIYIYFVLDFLHIYAYVCVGCILFADNYSLDTDNEAKILKNRDHFTWVCENFDLTLSTKKSKRVHHQLQVPITLNSPPYDILQHDLINRLCRSLRSNTSTSTVRSLFMTGGNVDRIEVDSIEHRTSISDNTNQKEDLI